MPSSQPTVDKISATPRTEPSVGCDEGTVDRLSEAPLMLDINQAQILYRLVDEAVQNGLVVSETRAAIRESLGNVICALRDEQLGSNQS